MLDAAITWIEANADLLGGIGTLSAATMFLITNGRNLLRRSAPGSGAITISSASGTVSSLTDAPPTAPEYGGRTAIAVLPFKEMGAIPDHFAEGLRDDLIADLQKSGYATPTKSALRRKNLPEEAEVSDEDAEQLIRRLGATYLLDGSIRCQENSYRIAAQLTDATGAVTWSERFNMTGDDMMAIQDAVARKTAEAVCALHAEKDIPSSGSRMRNAGPATQTAAIAASTSSNSRLIALILCLLFGALGVHRYYIGRWFTGLLYTLTGGLFVVGWLIDTLLLLFGGLTDRSGKRIRTWLPADKTDKS